MFYGCGKLTKLDVSGFDTANVLGFDRMFYGCKMLTELDVSGFDTSGAYGFSNMFGGCESLKVVDVSGFVSADVTDYNEMFCGCRELTELNLAGFATAGAMNMKKMFAGCSNLKTVYVSEQWDMSSVFQSEEMFQDSTKIVGGNGTAYDTAHTNGDYARIDKADAPGYFTFKEAPPTKEIFMGDLTGDRIVGIEDAQLALKVYTDRLAGKNTSLTNKQYRAADINGDGALTVEDAQYILKYYTEKNVAGKDITWDDVVKK